MTSHFDTIQRLFDEALQLTPAARAQRLEHSCRNDPKLREEVESLLSAHAHVSRIFKVFEACPGGPEFLQRRHTGERLGRYEIVQEIGRGGMGVIYLARDLQLERQVALKFLPAHLSAQNEAKAALVGEARSAAALDHPNIATIYDIGETEDGRLFIAMAYYEGQTLKELLQRQTVTLNQVLDLAVQLTRGVSAAHEKAIIHRDIKPGNLLLTGTGVLKILDFGLARRWDSEATQTGSIAGTLAYMSPEQVCGDRVDARTDLWSVGVVLYELISGRRPFQADSQIKMLHSILSEDPEPLRRLIPDLPPELERLVSRALAKQPSARYQRAGDMLTDLHHLRLSGPGGEIPVSSGHLPVYLTSFIGRDREIVALKRLVGSVREVTLTGPPGTGKTRLGVELARQLYDQFTDGVFFIPLGPVMDPALLLSFLVQALGVRQSGDLTPLQCLVRFLQGKRSLLVLDNFEQLVPSSSQVAELLAACPDLKILVTSRASLSISGEHEFPVSPLGVPAAGPQVEPPVCSEAVQLFIERALAVDPGFAVDEAARRAVGEICIRLDGLPLAIELAAARVKILSPQAILTRLEHRLDLLKGGPRDLPPRQRALREAIAWSYDLLEREEKKLLRRLSVCVGGHTIEAAQAIAASASPLELDLLDGLTCLVNSNLLRREIQADGEPRFLMLETIREFSLECLCGSGEEKETARAHQNFYLQFAESASSRLTGQEQARWLDRLDREADNLRAAMDWSLGAGNDTDSAVRFGIALWRFWLVRGLLSEGRQRLVRLAGLGDAGHPERKAQLLTAAGTLAHNLGDYGAARAHYEDSLLIYRSRNDGRGIAETLNHLGWVAWRQGDYSRAQELSQEALRLHRESGDRRGVAHALNNLGWVAQHQGDYQAASRLHGESLALRREISDARGIGFSLTNLAWSLAGSGHYQQASALLEEALSLQKAVGERQLLAWAVTIMALVRQSEGRLEEAAPLCRSAISQFRDIGDQYGVAFACHLLGQVSFDQGDLAEAEKHASAGLAIREAVGDRWGEAQSLCLMGRIAAQTSRADRAGDFLRRSLTIRQGLGDRAGISACLAELSRLGLPS